jgi:hypothetical protein
VLVVECREGVGEERWFRSIGCRATVRVLVVECR